MKSIVITSIYPPSQAVRKFASLQGYNLIVVGDKKTPVDWKHSDVTYLSVERQMSSGYELSKVLPFNHYCRKMVGYLHAIENGADVIIDTDDDNIPKENWAFPEFKGEFHFFSGVEGFVNIYQYFTDAKIWPRGLPLQLINEKTVFNTKVTKNVTVGIWQGLADGDPDVDAIYRLTSNEPCFFESKLPIVLDKNAVCPFNSQNTAIVRKLFPLLYLPTYVTFRFTDILRGLVAQPIMWKAGYHLGFTEATVVQERNPHDYSKDFESEIPMYRYSNDVVELVDKVTSGGQTIVDNLHNAYQELLKKKIVSDEEMGTLTAWLNDLGKNG